MFWCWWAKLLSRVIVVLGPMMGIDEKNTA